MEKEVENNGESPHQHELARCRARERLALITALLLIASIVPFWAYFFECGRPEIIMRGEWLSRSGAIISVLSLIAGLSLSSYRASFEGVGLSCFYKAKAFQKYKGFYRALTTAYVFLAIAGSLIWGYGDVVLR